MTRRITVETTYEEWQASGAGISSASDINRQGRFVRWDRNQKVWAGTEGRWRNLAEAIAAEATRGESWLEGRAAHRERSQWTRNMVRTHAVCKQLRGIQEKILAALPAINTQKDAGAIHR